MKQATWFSTAHNHFRMNTLCPKSYCVEDALLILPPQNEIQRWLLWIQNMQTQNVNYEKIFKNLSRAVIQFKNSSSGMAWSWKHCTHYSLLLRKNFIIMVLKMPTNGVCNASLARNYAKLRLTKFQFTSKDFNLEQNMTLGPPCKGISYSCRWQLTTHKLESCSKNTTLALRLGPLHENSILWHYRQSISLHTPPYRGAWKMENEVF